MKTKSIVAPKPLRRRMMDEGVKEKVEKVFIKNCPLQDTFNNVSWTWAMNRRFQVSTYTRTRTAAAATSSAGEIASLRRARAESRIHLTPFRTLLNALRVR